MKEPKRKRETREVWRQRIAAWEESGLSGREFAQQIDVNEKTLKYWRYELNRQDKARAQDPTQAHGKLLELRSALVKLPENASTGDSASLEIETPRGYRVRLLGSVDPKQLRVVLGALCEVER